MSDIERLRLEIELVKERRLLLETEERKAKGACVAMRLSDDVTQYEGGTDGRGPLASVL